MKIVFVSYLRVLHSVFPTGEKNHCHICKWKAHIVSLSLTHTHTLKYWIWFILAKCEICNMPHLRPSPAEPGWGDCPWGNISFSLTQSSIALWFLLTNSFLPFGAVHPFKEREVWGLLGSVTTSICLKMGRHHLDSGKKKRELQILSLQGSTVIQTHTFHPRTSLAAPVLQVRFRSKASHLGTLMLDLKDPWEGTSEWKQRGGSMERWRWGPEAELRCA